MRKILLAIFSFLIFLSSVFSVTSVPEGRPGAEYIIEAEFVPGENLVRGVERAVWRNGTNFPTAEIKIHLYMNSFRSNDDLFAREDRFEAGAAERQPNSFGGTDILLLRIGDGPDIVKKISIFETVMTVPLTKPVRPGESVTLTIEFETRIPSEAYRTGRAGGYFMVQGWYPKFGVFEDGAWNCRQFHPFTEFYSDFSDYDVRIKAPAHYILGGTGVKERLALDGGASAEWRFKASWVTDFAWAASPDFIVVKDKHRGVEIELLLQPFHSGAKNKYLKALRAAMDGFGGMLGDYPYSKITLLDPYPGTDTGGMEYPTFITGGTTVFSYAVMKKNLSPEGVTIHEFAHQYFYALLASDETAEPWLDEGFATFTEYALMDDLGWRFRFDSPRFSLVRSLDFYTLVPSVISDNNWSYLDAFLTGETFPAFSLRRLEFCMNKRWDSVTNDGMQAYDYDSYSVNSYSYPMLILRTLSNVYGREKLRSALKEYIRQWRFRHPKTEDAIRALTGAIGEDSERFLRQLLFTVGSVDYAATDIRSKTESLISPKSGRSGKSSASTRPLYRSSVTVERKGEVVLPVEIEAFFENGKTWRYKWDAMNSTTRRFDGWDDFSNIDGRRIMIREGAEGKWLKIYFLDSTKVVKAQVDPGYKLEVDTNLLNNSYALSPDRNLQKGFIARCFNLLYKSFLTLSLLN